MRAASLAVGGRLQLPLAGIAWLAATGAAIARLDQAVIPWVESHRLSGHAWLAMAWRWPGHLSFTLLVATALALWHARRWRAGLFLLCCGLSGGLV